MQIAPLPSNEAARLRVLRSLDLLDTPAEECFDRATRVLAQVLRVPIALVSLVDANRQWFKSKVGLDVCETSRDFAFCAHALGADGLLLVEDAQADGRFADNPLVLGAPFVRFYAGVPLRTEEGLVLGTLCAIDTAPRKLSEGERSALFDLARIVERDIVQRSINREVRQVNETERKARALMQAHFATAFQHAPTGRALVGLDGRFNDVNAKLCEITGYPREILLAKTFPDITYPDDLEVDLALLGELLQGQREAYSLEKRYIRQDGTLVWVELSVSLLRDEQGQPMHFIADILDISLRKQSEAMVRDHQAELEQRVQVRTAELMRSRATLQVITDNLPILISHVDRDLRYLFNNDVYRQVFGIPIEALIGRGLEDVLPADLFQELLPYFRRALAGERVTHDHVHYQADRNRVWAATYIPDIRDGEVHGFFVMSQDVTERKQVERSLRDKAMRDSLTGLPNRRALNELLAEISLRPAAACALLFLDLDGFKGVNDAYGHDFGDELLKEVAVRLQNTVRKADFVCRLAGDEFVVVAEGVGTEATARRIAESLCQAMAVVFELPGGIVKIGASVGVALHLGAADGAIHNLLNDADAAMYQAKRRGRNGYRLAEGLAEGLAEVASPSAAFGRPS